MPVEPVCLCKTPHDFRACRCTYHHGQAAAPPEGPEDLAEMAKAAGYWRRVVAAMHLPERAGPADLWAAMDRLEAAARLDAAPSVLSVEVAARIFHAMDCGPNHALGDLNPPRHEPNSDQVHWCDHMAQRFVHDLAAIAATE